MSFGKRLKQTRIDRELSVTELTRKSGLGKSTIHHIENGKSKMPDGATIIALCKSLNVSADYLLGLRN